MLRALCCMCEPINQVTASRHIFSWNTHMNHIQKWTLQLKHVIKSKYPDIKTILILCIFLICMNYKPWWKPLGCPHENLWPPAVFCCCCPCSWCLTFRLQNKLTARLCRNFPTIQLQHVAHRRPFFIATAIFLSPLDTVRDRSSCWKRRLSLPQNAHIRSVSVRV